MKKIVTVCYGKAEEWNSRKEAEDFFLRAMLMCEGAEQECYANVYANLQTGMLVCGDGAKREMTDEIVEQILEIRTSGKSNMFDVHAIQRIAYENGYYDLVLFLESSTEEYTHFILTGEVK